MTLFAALLLVGCGADREQEKETPAVSEPADTVVEETEVPVESLPPAVPSETPKPTPTPTPTPLFDIVDGETIWLSITRDQLEEYADYLRRELRLNDAALAGLLANIQEESGFDPNKIGDMGGAYGICQWYGPRLDQMVQFCNDNKLDPLTIEAQLAFLVYDLKNVYIYPYDLLRACKDTERGAIQAAYYFCTYYESPVNPEEKSPARERLTELLIYPTLNEISEEKR